MSIQSKILSYIHELETSVRRLEDLETTTDVEFNNVMILVGEKKATINKLTNILR